MKNRLFRILLASLLAASMVVPMIACTQEKPSDETNPSTQGETKPAETEADTETQPDTSIDPATFGQAAIVYDCDDGSVLSTYNQKTPEDYAGVCAFYEKDGYTVYSSTDMGGNLATTYVKGDAMAHVYFHPSNGELNIVLSDTAGATLPPATPAVTDGDTVCSVVQLEDATHVNGMGYVIQLKDGSYIVYDGAYNNQHSELKSYITKNHKGDGLPVIRAWIMTHSHNDHYPTFQAFCDVSARKPYATVEYFIYAPLRDEDFNLNGEELYLCKDFHDDLAKLEGTKLVYAHTGMEFKFCNLSMEILLSPESYYKTTNEKGNFNNTSIVSRLYGDGYSALFTGDTGIQCSTIMENLYGDYLKSDMCQISHHGVEDVPLSFYEKVQASILFYPCDKSLYDQTERHWEERRAMEGWACTKEILIAGLGQYTRAWGTTFDPNAPLSMPDYVREEEEVDIPDGVPYLATDKTSYAQGEPIMVTAYGAGFDWVGIVKKGETEALRWWHLAPVGIHVNAWSGKAFDATRLPANGTHSGALTPGAYTIVLLKDNKTIADGDFVAQVDITVTSDTYEIKAPSSDPIIHMNFDGKAEDSCGNATVTPTGNVTYTEGYKGQGAIVGKTNYLSIPGYNPGSDSFTIAVWAKVTEITGDPALFATKDWTHGKKVGFAFAINGTSNLHVNIGDGAEHRIDIKPTLPNGTLNTWVHYTMVVDRTTHEMKVSINFGEFETVTIPAELVNSPYEGLGALVIGQDATGKYPQGSMTCVVDEFMVFEKALTQAEVTALGASFNS